MAKIENLLNSPLETVDGQTIKAICKAYGKSRKLKAKARNREICDKLNCSLGQLYAFWENRLTPNEIQVYAIQMLPILEGETVYLFRFPRENEALIAHDRDLQARRMSAAAALCNLRPCFIDWQHDEYLSFLKRRKDTPAERQRFSQILASKFENQC